jgi:hypothetical protein
MVTVTKRHPRVMHRRARGPCPIPRELYRRATSDHHRRVDSTADAGRATTGDDGLAWLAALDGLT